MLNKIKALQNLVVLFYKYFGLNPTCYFDRFVLQIIYKFSRFLKCELLDGLFCFQIYIKILFLLSHEIISDVLILDFRNAKLNVHWIQQENIVFHQQELLFLSKATYLM